MINSRKMTQIPNTIASMVGMGTDVVLLVEEGV